MDRCRGFVRRKIKRAVMILMAFSGPGGCHRFPVVSVGYRFPAYTALQSFRGAEYGNKKMRRGLREEQ